jgi:hypothetical protein
MVLKDLFDDDGRSEKRINRLRARKKKLKEKKKKRGPPKHTVTDYTVPPREQAEVLLHAYDPEVQAIPLVIDQVAVLISQYGAKDVLLGISHAFGRKLPVNGNDFLEFLWEWKYD